MKLNLIKIAAMVVLAFGAFGAEPESQGISRVPIIPETSTYVAGAAIVAIVGGTWLLRKKDKGTSANK